MSMMARIGNNAVENSMPSVTSMPGFGLMMETLPKNVMTDPMPITNMISRLSHAWLYSSFLIIVCVRCRSGFQAYFSCAACGQGAHRVHLSPAFGLEGYDYAALRVDISDERRLAVRLHPEADLVHEEHTIGI